MEFNGQENHMETWVVVTGDVEKEHQNIGIETYIPMGNCAFIVGDYDPEGREMPMPFTFSSKEMAYSYISNTTDKTRRVERMLITFKLE